MPTLSVEVILYANTTNFGGLVTFVKEAKELGVTPSSPLVDGEHVRVVGRTEEAGGVITSEHYATFEEFTNWVEQMQEIGVNDDELLEGGYEILGVSVPITSTLVDNQKIVLQVS